LRRAVANLLRRLLAARGIQLAGPAESAGRRAFAATLERWAVADLDPDPQAGFAASGIVFSRDRALQLHALLSGWTENVVGGSGLAVLWTASGAAHEASYRELERIWTGRVRFVRESSFRDDLLRLVEGAGCTHLFFLTDDAVVLRPLDLAGCLLPRPSREIFSLTHDRTLDWCFVAGRPQRIPSLSERSGGRFEWTWAEGEEGADWSYPLSVDGKIFSRREVALLLEELPFRNPNTLESALQVYQPLFARRRGVCLDAAAVVNVPCNRVQDQFLNPTTGAHAPDELLVRWNRGERIAHEEFLGRTPRSAETSSFTFVSRA
jgi:hypothetical protein